MDLTFGMYLDGTTWTDKQASLGKLQLGPSGLLGLLETRLGLGGPVAHPAQRINAYMHLIQQCDRSGAWFHDSFEADPWSTAKQMLAWRDELIEAGWQGQGENSSSPRLRALASIEKSNRYLPLGQADRLQAVLSHLNTVDSVDVKQIQLSEPLEMLPPILQKIIGKIEEMGCSISSIQPGLQNPCDTNLTRIQKALSGDVAASPVAEKDESILLVKATDEWEAADHLALWLAIHPDKNRDVTIIAGSDSALLDQALQRQNLPQLGKCSVSPWRSLLQVLPLVLANVWYPMDINLLVELLSLPKSPIPSSVCRHLLKALSQEPGIGGPAWKHALQVLTDDCEEYLLKKGSTQAKEEAAAFAAKINAFLGSDRYDADTGIPHDKLKERCDWVIQWLSGLPGDDHLKIAARNHTILIRQMAEGKDTIPRIILERMLDSVIGAGSTAPHHVEQASAWQVVSHPGQITSPRHTVIWWSFRDQSTVFAHHWSRSERDYLHRLKIDLESPNTARQREAYTWRTGLSYATDTFLMFYPMHINGEKVCAHPFWDEIRMAAANNCKDDNNDELFVILQRDCHKLNNRQLWRLAGRKINLKKIQIAPPKAMAAKLTIPRDTISLPASLSYSQMSAMISCPMKWTLQYHAGLRTPETLNVPTGNTMLGNLCHRIVQQLYAEPVRQWTPDEAEAQAKVLYDTMVPFMASELKLDGKQLDNRRCKEGIVQAIRRLVESITQLGLVVERSEEKLDGCMDSIPFIGYADLLLRDKKGHHFVFDLKWSGSSNYRKKEIEEGESLQLAVYSWLLKSLNPGKTVHSGYFMLAQGELLSNSPLLKDESLSSIHTMERIWEMSVRSWQQRIYSLREGELQASGVAEQQLQDARGLSDEQLEAQMRQECFSQDFMYQRPQCSFCDFTKLCSYAGGEA
jgi:RecB family exonuclease